MNLRTVVAAIVGLVLIAAAFALSKSLRPEWGRAQVASAGPEVQSADPRESVLPEAIGEAVAQPADPLGVVAEYRSEPARRTASPTAALTVAQGPVAPSPVAANQVDASPVVPAAQLPSQSQPQLAVLHTGEASVSRTTTPSCFGTASSPSESIGIAVARGSFHIDGSIIQETATLFDGAHIRSGSVPVVLAFTSGTRFRLSENSEAVLSKDHFLLRAGTGEILNANGCEIHALGLRVVPQVPATAGRVHIASADNVTVTASAGSFHVLNARRQLVANVDQPAALGFSAKTLNQEIPRVTGCLERRDGQFVLTDELTTLAAEVVPARIADSQERLNDEVRKRVEVLGQAKSARAPRPILIEAANLQRLGSCQGFPWWTLASAALVCGNNCWPEPPVSR